MEIGIVPINFQTIPNNLWYKLSILHIWIIVEDFKLEAWDVILQMAFKPSWEGKLSLAYIINRFHF